MKRKFFIFSLPRSGSSWLSTFLSMPGSYCYHEPYADGGVIELEKMWAGRPETCVGAIDTSGHQRKEWPVCDAYFTLHRHKHEIESSLKLRGWVLNIDAELEKLDRVSKGCIPIYYNWLNEISYLENIWNSITGCLPFDRERAEYLTEMNIQRKFANVQSRAHRTAERKIRSPAAL